MNRLKLEKFKFNSMRVHPSPLLCTRQMHRLFKHLTRTYHLILCANTRHCKVYHKLHCSVLNACYSIPFMKCKNSSPIFPGIFPYCVILFSALETNGIPTIGLSWFNKKVGRCKTITLQFLHFDKVQNLTLSFHKLALTVYGEPELVEHSKAAWKSFKLTKGSLHSVKNGLCRVLKWYCRTDAHISNSSKIFWSWSHDLELLFVVEAHLTVTSTIQFLVITNIHYLVVY